MRYCGVYKAEHTTKDCLTIHKMSAAFPWLCMSNFLVLLSCQLRYRTYSNRCSCHLCIFCARSSLYFYAGSLKFLCWYVAAVLSKVITTYLPGFGCIYVQANYNFCVSCLAVFLSRLITVSVSVYG